MPLPGSIELMQAVVLVSSAIGMVIATWEDSHARVRLLVDRLGGVSRAIADRLSDAMTFIFVLALLAGSLWLSVDLWDGYEQSEVVGVPWSVLRLIANLCLAAIALILLRPRVAGDEAMIATPGTGLAGIVNCSFCCWPVAASARALGLVGMGGLALILGPEAALIKAGDGRDRYADPL